MYGSDLKLVRNSEVTLDGGEQLMTVISQGTDRYVFTETEADAAVERFQSMEVDDSGPAEAYVTEIRHSGVVAILDFAQIAALNDLLARVQE